MSHKTLVMWLLLTVSCLGLFLLLILSKRKNEFSPNWLNSFKTSFSKQKQQVINWRSAPQTKLSNSTLSTFENVYIITFQNSLKFANYCTFCTRRKTSLQVVKTVLLQFTSTIACSLLNTPRNCSYSGLIQPIFAATLASIKHAYVSLKLCSKDFALWLLQLCGGVKQSP